MKELRVGMLVPEYYEVWMEKDGEWEPIPNTRWPLKGFALRAKKVWERHNSNVKVVTVMTLIVDVE